MKVTLDEFQRKLEKGLDIIIGIRGSEYFIGAWYDEKRVISQNPNGPSSFYPNAKHMLQDHRIDGVPLEELIDEIDIIYI